MLLRTSLFPPVALAPSIFTEGSGFLRAPTALLQGASLPPVNLAPFRVSIASVNCCNQQALPDCLVVA